MNLTSLVNQKGFLILSYPKVNGPFYFSENSDFGGKVSQLYHLTQLRRRNLSKLPPTWNPNFILGHIKLFPRWLST